MSILRIPPCADARDAYFGVTSARSVDCYYHLFGVVLFVNDNFLDQDAREPLLRALSGAWGIPCCRQIVGQCQ